MHQTCVISTNLLRFNAGIGDQQRPVSGSYTKSYQPGISYKPVGTTPTNANVPFKQSTSKDFSSATDKAEPNPLKLSGASLTINDSKDALQMKFVLLAAEVDRLIICNNASLREIDSWKTRYADLERAKDLEISQLRQDLNRHPSGGSEPSNVN